MWPLKSKRHLRYDSVDAWIEGERIPTPVTSIKDEKLRDDLFTKLGELRQHLFNKHLEQLSETERQQLKTGIHASQSHEKLNVAKEFAEELRSKLSQCGVDVSVIPGKYHMNRVVLNVMVDANVPKARIAKDIPQFFHGFEVLVLRKK